MAEIKLIPTRTTLLVDGLNINILNEYIQSGLPYTLQSRISESTGVQEGISFVEGELLIKMVDGKYPTEIDYFISDDGTLTVKSESGDVNQYSIDEEGFLIYNDEFFLAALNASVNLTQTDFVGSVQYFSNSFSLVLQLNNQNNDPVDFYKTEDNFSSYITVSGLSFKISSDAYTHKLTPIFSSSNFILFGSINNSGGYFLTQDGGINFTSITAPSGEFFRDFYGAVIDKNGVQVGNKFVFTNYDVNGNRNYSLYTVDMNGNLSSPLLSFENTNSFAKILISVLNQEGFTMNDNNFYKTTDGGLNWTQTATGTNIGTNPSNIRKLLLGEGSLFLLSGSNIYKSDNEGVTFQLIKQKTLDSSSFFVGMDVVYYGTGLSQSKLVLFEVSNSLDIMSVFISEDLGNSFIEVKVSIEDIQDISIVQAKYIGNFRFAICGVEQVAGNNLKIIDLSSYFS